MSSKHSFDDTAAVDLDDLREMDVVVFSDEPPTTQGTATNGVDSFSRPRRQLGAIQENGRIAPLCVWTLEPAFGDSLEFLVDEHALHNNNNSGNGGRDMRHVRIHGVVPHTAVSYGSRQVGGGMGPGNPHGEESEMLYYIEQSVLYNNNNKQAEGDDDGDLDIEIIVKPELEIFW